MKQFKPSPMKKSSSFISLLLLVIATWYSLYRSTPHQIVDLDAPQQEFSTLRALEHVKHIARAPHYVGSKAHEQSKQYIIQELQKLGLETEIQEGFSIFKTGELSKPQNILARIKGHDSKKALVVLSHYDSDPHASPGASDAASGVATILEAVRAFIATHKTPKNDIIICFTDSEELGLNGADLFVNKHPWAKDVGMVLNFEARGSGGESYMLVETDAKNGRLIEEFSNANVSHPVANSLSYSIYKMLPNDTDLTVFRKDGDIDGFNFAFIGDHFDYHTANDTWENLDLNTLQHQGSYLMPLMNHFSEIDLTTLKSDKDYIYFDIPIFKIIKYPFDWIYFLLWGAILLFFALIIYGGVRHRIHVKSVLKGTVALLLSLILAGSIGFGLWKFIIYLYPHYNEIQHGFTYNGYTYIYVFVFLAIAISFRIYSKFHDPENLPSLLIAPFFLWLCVCVIVALYLKGASYFIILAYFGLLSLFIILRQKQPNPYVLILLGLPAIFILVPFIKSFPIALGLKIVFASSILTVFLFSLLLPILGFYRRKKSLSYIALGLTILFFIIGHTTASFSKERQKPNSLVYVLDTDENKAVWGTYDTTLDTWTKNYINPTENVAKAYNGVALQSKYGTRFTFATKAPIKNIDAPEFHILHDTIINTQRTVKLSIIPQRTAQRMDVYTKTLFNFDALTVNGVTVNDFSYRKERVNAFTKRWKLELLTYHITNNEPLELSMQFHKDSVPVFTVFESSYDLLENTQFSIPAREKTMMPKPFIVNDAVILKKSFILHYTPPKKMIDSIPSQIQEN